MAQMTDAEFQAWLDQHGGEVGRKDIEDEIDDPSGALDSKGNPKKVKRVDRTEITAKDGATITLRRTTPGIPGPDPGMPGGTTVERPYEVIATSPPKASSAGGGHKEGDTRGPQTGPTREVYEGGQWVVRPNPVYRPEAPSGGHKEGDTRGPTNQPTREVYRGGQWVVEPNPLYQPPKPDKPGAPTLKPDGKGGSIAVQAMPDGTIKSTPLPNIPSEATRITVDGVVYEKGPDGSFAPAKGIPLPGATSKNVDPFTPDPSQPDLGVGAWAAAQRAKIGQPSEAGGITQSEYDQAAKAAHDQASVYIQNVTSSQAVRRQQEQDERGQRNDLSNQSAADYGRAQGVFSDILQYTKPGSRAIMDVIPGLMAEQAKYRQQREATARPATPLHPMFQALPVAAGVAPAAPPAAPMAPEQAAAVAPPPEIPMTPERAAGIMANPVFRPAPMVAAPVPAPPVRDDYATNPGATPINPPAGQPGHNPNAPVGMTPGPVSGWAAPMVAPAAPAMAPTGQPVLALQQPPAFDPMDTAGRMARMGVPQEAIAQALAELGLAG